MGIVSLELGFASASALDLIGETSERWGGVLKPHPEP